MSINCRELYEYVAGVVCGDGSLWYDVKGRTYHVLIYDNNYTFIMTLKDMLQYCIGHRNIRVRSIKSGRCFELDVRGLEFYTTILDLIKHLLSNPSIPFVRGLTDAEGSLYHHGTITLEISNTKQDVVNAIYKLLESLKVKCFIVTERRKPPRRDIYKVRIRGWNNVIHFINVVKPLHPKIRDKLQNLMYTYRSLTH